MRNKVDESVVEQSIRIIQTRISNSSRADVMDEARVILPPPNSLLPAPHTVARERNRPSKLQVSPIDSKTAECPAQFLFDFCYFQAEELVEETCTIKDILKVMDDVYEFCIYRLNNQKEMILIQYIRGKTRSVAATYMLAKTQNTSIHQACKAIQQKRGIMIPDD